MSVDFSNVQVGDRIKLTRENGDEVTVTVRDMSGYKHRVTGGDCFDLYASEWGALEILEKALPEVPTRVGAVIHNGKKDALTSSVTPAGGG